MGVIVPNQRKDVQKFYREISVDETVELLHSKVHEHRLTSLLLLVKMYEKSKDDKVKKSIYDIYITNTDHIKNWQGYCMLIN